MLIRRAGRCNWLPTNESGQKRCHNAAATFALFLPLHPSARRRPNQTRRAKTRTGGSMSGKQLGFIGVGTMGHHMAGRLLEAGYDLIIYDTNETAMQRLEQRGAKCATSPADV